MSTTARLLRRLHLPTGHSPIRILNDDVLLHIFYVYLLDIKDEEQDENVQLVRKWYRQRWWYKPASVCRRWRQLILASASRLDLHLLCTYGVPIADMLAHSPPLPLTVFYDDQNREMTAEDEEGVLLAFSHCDRLHRVALCIPATKLVKFTTLMNEEFPILERICIGSQSHDSTPLASLKSFRAPNLRHMSTTCLPTPSPLPPNTTNLVGLELIDIPPSAYFPPKYILTRLSHMSQLETLVIQFHSPLPNREVTRQLLNTPFPTNVTLPHLHAFSFRGVSAYLEGLLSRITMPSLNSLNVQFFNQLTFTVPRLLQFMQASEGLAFRSIELTFYEGSVDLISDPHRSSRERPLRLRILCSHLDWQVAAAAQILGKLSPVLSAVEELTLCHQKPDLSSGLHNEFDQIQWRELFRPLGGLKKLCVPDSLFGEGRHSLSHRLEDKQLFPNLPEVQYSGSWQCCGTEFKLKKEWDLHRLKEKEKERDQHLLKVIERDLHRLNMEKWEPTWKQKEVLRRVHTQDLVLDRPDGPLEEEVREEMRQEWMLRQGLPLDLDAEAGVAVGPAWGGWRVGAEAEAGAGLTPPAGMDPFTFCHTIGPIPIPESSLEGRLSRHRRRALGSRTRRRRSSSREERLQRSIIQW